MNYQKLYDKLIEKRQLNPISKKDCYCEKHHIVPRCLCGTDDPSNLVNLTAREHYVAHLLLLKSAEQKYGENSEIYKKLLWAISYFKLIPKNATNEKLIERTKIKFNSRLYESLRIKAANLLREKAKERDYTGERNPMYGHKRTKEEKKKISKNRIESGCSAGEKNPMYGRPCTYKMTEEEKEEWRKNIRTSCADLCSMYDPKTQRNKNVHKKDIEKYLKMGYILGQCHPNRKSTKGYVRVRKPNETKYFMVSKDNVDKFLKDGYILYKK